MCRLRDGHGEHAAFRQEYIAIKPNPFVPCAHEIDDAEQLDDLTVRESRLDEHHVIELHELAFFDSKQQMLELQKDIFLQSSTGYEAKLSQASVDMNKGLVTSNEHVDVKLLNGTLVADGLKIINSGEIVEERRNATRISPSDISW